MTQAHDWTIVQNEKRWSILTKQKRFAAWAVFSSIGSMMLGFDFGIAGTCTAFPAFQKQFGIPFASQASGYLIPARVQAGWNGASAGGEIVGVLIAGPLLNWLGRRHTLLLGAILTAVGVGIQQASKDWVIFLVGRLINAIGFGAVFITSPVWIGETVRPELRGFFLCLMNTSIVFGQFLLSCIARGTSQIEGRWSYDILILLQYAFVAPLFFVYPFYPESPYFLLSKNKPEAARKSLLKIHGSSDMGLIEAELKRITEDCNFARELQAAAGQDGSPIFQVFRGTNLKRTLIAMLPAAGQQLIGAAFVLGYITYFLSLVGVKEFFTVSVVLYVVMLISTCSAFYFIETAGRRTLLVPGIAALAGICLLMGIMGCIHAAGALWVIVVCIFLWAIVYQLTIGAVGFALASEISTMPLRATTQSMVAMTQGIVGWIIGFVSPYMINPDAGNLGAKVGFVFAGIGIPLSIIFYFYIPETKGLSFEDIDYLFTTKVPCRKFTSAINEHRAHGGALEVQIDEKIVANKSIEVEEVEKASV